MVFLWLQGLDCIIICRFFVHKICIILSSMQLRLLSLLLFHPTSALGIKYFQTGWFCSDLDTFDKAMTLLYKMWPWHTSKSVQEKMCGQVNVGTCNGMSFWRQTKFSTQTLTYDTQVFLRATRKVITEFPLIDQRSTLNLGETTATITCRLQL